MTTLEQKLHRGTWLELEDGTKAVADMDDWVIKVMLDRKWDRDKIPVTTFEKRDGWYVEIEHWREVFISQIKRLLTII